MMKNGKDELDLETEKIDAEIGRLEKKKRLQVKKRQLDKLKEETGEIPMIKKLLKIGRGRI